MGCLMSLNFFHTLVIQTAGPLALVVALEMCGRACKKRATRAEEQGNADRVANYLASTCSSTSFFLIFLLYPGSSAKTFSALMCTPFDGEGEDQTSFLTVDLSISCDTSFYRAIMLPYTLCCVLIYPIGVPAYYALIMYRNREELQEIGRLEVSISNEAMRVKLGEFLSGRARREYQKEIDAAKAREAELRSGYDERRAGLPSHLRMLTDAYDMRTYAFEIFECLRKVAIIFIPIFFTRGSPMQLFVGLIICFLTFGVYTK